MTATLAILASFGLIACGLWFAVSGKGASTRIKVLSVEVDGGLGAIMVIIGVVGLGLTAWWDWSERSTPVDDDPDTGFYEPEDYTDDAPPIIGDAVYTVPEPWTYGDDYELDILSDACWQGDMNSCDQLFYNSLPDSNYEFTGATCGDLWAFDPGTCVLRFGESINNNGQGRGQGND